MRRMHLIEIHEQSWYPHPLRNLVTDTLQFMWNIGNVYGPIVPRLQKALGRLGANQVIDLCSGGGGPWLRLHGLLATSGDSPIHVCLTDKYPNARAFDIANRISRQKISFHACSVDARDVPSDLIGFRTLFTSFHHFRSGEARSILQDAVDKGQGIGVFEVSGRYAWALLGVFLTGMIHFVSAPFMRPFLWSRMLWTYVVPVIPVVLVLDGITSCLRTRSPQELRELVELLVETDYDWEIGEEKGNLLKLRITYLIGCPRFARTVPAMIPAKQKADCSSASVFHF